MSAKRYSIRLLGESVLLEEGTYPVGATCLEATLTCGFDRKTFEALVLNHPDFGLVVVRNLSRRIQQLSGKVGVLSGPNLEDRLYEVLVNVAVEVGAPTPGGPADAGRRCLSVNRRTV